jgi:hypothetical protein
VATRQRAGVFRVTRALLIGVAAVLLSGGSAPAQPIPRDSIAIEQKRIRDELTRAWYWIDRRSTSGVDDCQIKVSDICIAEHQSFFGMQHMVWSNGEPRRFRVVLPRPGEPPITIPDRIQELADSMPDNGWAVGHLAYIHSYAGGIARALQQLNGCRASEWWCTALRAFVNHSYARYNAADSLFERALALMPAETSCRWRDISSLLDNTAAADYRRRSCTDRRDVEDRFWWLSDPLYVMPGNDRRSEHYARRVIDSLFRGGPSPFNTDEKPATWEDTMGEILIRYGMASHWIVPGKLQGFAEDRIRWVHLHTPSYSFAPRRFSADPRAAIDESHFDVDVQLDSVLERYHPDYDYVTGMIHSQSVALPRGDSMLVAAAVDLTREVYAEAAPFTAAMYVARDHRSPATMRVERGVRDRALFTAAVPREDVLLGIEAASEPLRVAGRTRYTLQAPGGAGLWLSQPLLYTGGAERPARSAREAVQRMLGSEVLTRGAQVGVYWEVGGAAQGASARFSIRAVPTNLRNVGFFRRVFGATRSLLSDTLVISWSDPITSVVGISSHSVALDLQTLQDGEYRLEMEVQVEGGGRATSHRTITIVRADPRARDLVSALQQQVPEVRSGEALLDPPLVRRRVVPIIPP